MEGEFLLKALETLGVPAAICFGLMFWVRKDIRDLTQSINKLAEIIDNRVDNLERNIGILERDISEIRQEVNKFQNRKR